MAQELDNFYEFFMLKTVIKKYFPNNTNIRVLGNNFIDSYYFMLIEELNISGNKADTEYYLIVENCKKPVIVQLKKTDEQSDYIKFEKKHFRKSIGEKIFKILAQRGICTQEHIALSESTNPLLIHRLNACLYKNILGLEVHHNNKDKTDNYIINLTPIKHKLHDFLDRQQGGEYEILTKRLHKKFVQEVEKLGIKRNTLSNRNEIVLAVLLDLNYGKSVKKITNKNIKKTKVYQIKRHYFYIKDFIKYFCDVLNKKIELFDGIDTKILCKHFYFSLSKKMEIISNREFRLFVFEFFKDYKKRHKRS